MLILYNKTSSSWHQTSAFAFRDRHLANERSPAAAPFVRSLAMLAEVVTADGQDAPPGEHSSKARRSASLRLCSFARFARWDSRGSADAG
jgi:hypothetical protein